MKSIKSSIPGVPFDVQGNWYAPFDMMMNDLGFWYPILLRTGVPTPRTIIINADSKVGLRDLGNILDGVTPQGMMPTLGRIIDAMDEVGYPCFFRGGQTSAKHNWKDTCFVSSRPTSAQIAVRMASLVEYCTMANIGASPLLYENWVVRQLLPTTPLFTHFAGDMPIVREVRFFLKDGAIDCRHPYWPKKALLRDGPIDDSKFEELIRLTDNDHKTLTKMGLCVASFFPGYWSCDFLQTSNGTWYCTDMARGEDSYHDPDCSIKKPPG